MEKEKLKQPYESADLKVLQFGSNDIITQSGYGGEGDDDLAWT